MTYFYFPGWGMYNLNGVAEKELVATFAHGYRTAADAQSHPNKSPDAQQVLLLQTFNAASLSPIGAGGISGVQSTPHGTKGVTGALNNLAGTAAIGDFFNRLTQGNTWLRVGEVIAGLLLLYLGLNAAMKNTAVGNATQAATDTTRKVGKKAVEGLGFVPK